MTELERRILLPLACRLRMEYAAAWSDLKYETQFGPETMEFPCYPAALDFQYLQNEQSRPLILATRPPFCNRGGRYLDIHLHSMKTSGS